ncbi:Kynurenine formamidase [Singulisphaera sp. GP187]|uniref:cyclase family protein n=1 Tax=Singulisphaera sp. GP187 TaxID=1882752 RepID=UPI00092A4A66|nr:cyclase family protein [Singulisphaera sp. GP187]SIN79495.1 Kynurenine formamidase [Singulisphaera sp. GP187]
MSRTTASIPVLALALVGVGTFVAVRAQAPERAPGPLKDLAAKAIDLTYAFDKDTIYWPTDKSFQWDRTTWGPSKGGYWYASATFAASEHGGTHLDSPIHFGEGQATADQIPLTKLIGPAVVVDVQKACARDRDYQLRTDDLEAWERAHGRIPDGAIVVMRSGWGRFWPDPKAYLGSDAPGDTAHLHFPGVSRAAAEWLVAHRRVAGVGVDTASLDPGPSRDFMAHRVLNGAGIYGLENVANLNQVPESGATLIALPMKIRGGSGGPTRIIAILP